MATFSLSNMHGFHNKCRECSALSNGIRQKDVCSTVYLVQNNDLFTNWLLFSDKILTKG